MTDQAGLQAPTRAYPKAPIVEAVIELSFGTALDRNAIERAASVFGADYTRQDEAELSVVLDGGSVRQTLTPAGVRLSHPFPARNILIRDRSVVYARLAPYPGWDVFFAEASDAFRRVRGRLGYRPVRRVGARYVNRIDIPKGPDAPPLRYNDYLAFGPPSTSLLGMNSPTNYLVQCDFFPDSGWAKAIVRSGTQTPALIRHASLLLDIDVFVDTAVPQQEAEIEALMHRLRDLKNRVFEDCITDEARALFGAVP